MKHVGIPWQFPCDMTIPGVPRLYCLYSCQSLPNQIPVLLSEQTCRRNSLDRNLSYWCLWLKIRPDVDVFYIPRSPKESKVVQRFKAGSVFLGLLLVPCSALHCQRLSVDKTVLSSHVNFNGQKTNENSLGLRHKSHRWVTLVWLLVTFASVETVESQCLCFQNSCSFASYCQSFYIFSLFSSGECRQPTGPRCVECLSGLCEQIVGFRPWLFMLFPVNQQRFVTF